MDIKLKKLAESWQGNTDGWNAILAMLAGCKHKGITMQRGGAGSSKLVMTNKGETRKVPIKWLCQATLEAIRSQVVVGEDGEYTTIQKLWALGHDVPESGKILDSLVKKPENCIRVSRTGKTIFPVVQSKPIKPQDAASGMQIKEDVVKTSVFCIPSKDGKFYAILGKEPKKALQREAKLVSQGTDCIPMPGMYGFVIESVPSELKGMFGFGAAYVAPSLIQRIGCPRVTAPIGVKAVLAPMPVGLAEIEEDVIIMSASSWKSGLNGVLSVLKGGHALAMTMNDTDARLCLELHKSSMQIGDHTVYGWIVPLDGLVVTNPYSLHKLKWKEDEDMDVVEDDDSYDMDDASPYMVGLQRWKSEEGFSPVQFRKELLESGEAISYGDVVDIKAMSLDVVRSTYGSMVAEEFISSIVEESGFYKEESVGLLTDTLCSEVMEKGVFEYMANKVFGGIRVTPSAIGPDSMDGISADEAESRINVLMNGDSVWPGIKNLKPSVLDIYGHKFFIPGYRTMKKFITDPKDGGLILSGPMKDLLLLVVAYKNRYTNWASKARQHRLSINSALSGKSLDRISVKGRSFVILPGDWLRPGEVCVPYGANRLGISNGDVCVYAKSPVLFGGSIAGVKVYTGLPKRLFGETLREERRGLDGVMYVAPETLLANQDDCDGDMAALYVTKAKLPIEQPREEWQLPWINKYTEKEMDLDLKMYEYGVMEADFTQPIAEILENEAMIGGGTNSLLILCHILQMWSYRNPGMDRTSRIIRDLYAQELQNCIAGMKHDVHGADFSSVRMHNAFNMDTRGIWVEGMRSLVSGFVEETDINSFIGFVFSMDKNIAGKSSLLSRRSSSEVCLMDPALGENAMGVLDVFTRSVSESSLAICPSYGSSMEGILNNNKDKDDIFMKRYCLIGQDLSIYALGTVRGHILRAAKALRESILKDSMVDTESSVDSDSGKDDDLGIDMSMFI